MIYSLKNKDKLKDLDELDDFQSKVKQDRLVEKIGKQGYHYDMKELLRPITKTLTNRRQKFFEEGKPTTKANMELDESKQYIKTLEAMNINEVIHSSLIRTVAKLLVPKNKNQFQLLEDLGSDNWNDYKMNGEKVTLYDEKLLFKERGIIFTLKGDFLSRKTDYDFKKTHLPDAKQIINFLDERHFDIHSKGKSSRHENLLGNFYNKRVILASGLNTISLPENPYELFDRLKLLLQEKQASINSDMNNQEMVAIFDKLLEYKCITSTQHKKILQI